MKSMLHVAASRRGRVAVPAAWALVVLIALVLGLPGQFAAGQDDSSAAFLPADAESTRASQVIDRVEGVEKTSIIVAYFRPNGMTDADRQRVAADQQQLVAAMGTDPALRALDPETELRFSNALDGALLIADVRAGPDSEAVPPAVASVRERLSGDDRGLQVRVTGAAAFAADAEGVFDTIDGVLLLGAGLLVVVLLLAIYRSPVFLLFPLLCVACADVAMRAIGAVATDLGLSVNSQSSSIVSVLMLGAGTDYALLLAARYRDELRRHEVPAAAMAVTLRSTGPAIAGSVLTVVVALLCLTVAETAATRGIGPIAAIGVTVVGLAMLTLLPALLVLTGRRAFWRPAVLGWGDGVPRVGDQVDAVRSARWSRLGAWVRRRPRPVWAGTALVLAILSLGWLGLETGLTRPESFREDVESVEGQRLVSRAFTPGAGAPTEVFLPIARIDRLSAVEFAVRDMPGVAFAQWGERMERGMVLTVILDPRPYTPEAFALIPRLRQVVREAGGPGLLVGGETATEHDLRVAAAEDRRRIVPLTLVAVLAVLALLLRSLVGPLALMASTLLSFGASVGLSVLVFRALGLPEVDPSLPVFAFVFLVALGSDYNIFLMSRAREEAERHGTREGMERALAATGGVITSAGLVLAGTFLVLVLLPLTFLIQMGFVIAVGILLDTFVVRSLLVPALVMDLGERTWAPGRLHRTP